MGWNLKHSKIQNIKNVHRIFHHKNEEGENEYDTKNKVFEIQSIHMEYLVVL